MVTLQQAAMLQALEALERADKISGHANNRKAMAGLRQALEADTKPCACCGEGNARLSVIRVCDTCGSEYAGQAEMDMAKRIEAGQKAEPVAWECKAGGLKRLTQHQYEAQSDAIKRHYTRIQPAPQPALTAIPSDWKPMPVEPTREMLTTWIKADVVSNRTAPDLYRAMLAAAPEAPAQQPLTDEQIDACFPVQWEGEFYKPWRKAVARAIERAHGIK